MIDPGLTGKRAIVAGGASGIGRAIAVALAAEGSLVAVVDRSPVTDPSEVLSVTAELGEEEASAAAVEEAVRLLGGLDLLVYTAAQTHHEPALELTPAAWAATLASNVSGCVWTCREAARRMVAAGAGSILVVGSTSLYTPAAGEAAYRASKAALKAYTEVLALELAPRGVRVNVLTPGAFRTPLTAHMTPEQRVKLVREIPLEREGVADELCATALLLLSDRLSPYTTGAEFVVDGGLRLRALSLETTPPSRGEGVN
jgi:NAD(P)-dependent dehydrogenase (short-subunit alcohol dehydrogenase family)